LNQTDQLKDLVSLRDVQRPLTGCKSNAHILVWESVFFQVLSHQGESDCGSDVALPLHPTVSGHFGDSLLKTELIFRSYYIKYENQ
jgi:hypothetical protein